MRNEKLFQEFIAFCESQPEDKEINHSYWCTCAVGEFLSSKNLHMDRQSASWNTPELEQLLGDSESVLFKAVGGSWGNIPSKTYGEFTKFLKQYI